ncbi:hypothetical protein AcV7_003619 [Taiwanofungus camphoratus]|nr:hypothetical protein AcV7_003619 [Antrodia cinnamomea]
MTTGERCTNSELGNGRGSNLRDRLTFPAFAECPDENDIPLHYYDQDVNSGHAGPRRHWCFLGEIVDFIVLGRLTVDVRDVSGNLARISFYDDNRGMRFVEGNRLKKGYTVVHLYPTQHWFLDMSRGIRVEEEETATIIPCSMDALFAANDKLQKPPSTTCWMSGCEKSEGLARCGKCLKAQYCGRDHQIAAWKTEHKVECKALQALEWYTKKDWTIFHGWFSF